MTPQHQRLGFADDSVGIVMHIVIVNRGMGIYRAGAERFDYEIALALQSFGHRIEIVTGKRMFGDPDRPIEGVPVQYISTPFMRDLSQKIGGRIGNLLLRLDHLMFSEKCAEYLCRRADFDVLQVCSLPRLVGLQRIIRVPVIVWYPGIPSVKDLSFIGEAAAVVANGDAFLRIREKLRKDVFYVPLGLDTQKFCRRRSDLREHLGIGHSPVVLYTGRMAPVKNIPMLLHAFKIVRERVASAKLILVGAGPSYDKVIHIIDKMKLRESVYAVGFVDEKVFVDYYSIADVFAISSSYDNDPNVIYEAMSCSLPIVATRVGGIPLQIEDGINGYLVEKNDVTAFADRIVALLMDHRIRQRMGATNRNAVGRLTWVSSANQLVDIYKIAMSKY